MENFLEDLGGVILPAQRIEGEFGLQAVGLNGAGHPQPLRQALGERFQQGGSTRPTGIREMILMRPRSLSGNRIS